MRKMSALAYYALIVSLIVGIWEIVSVQTCLLANGWSDHMMRIDAGCPKDKELPPGQASPLMGGRSVSLTVVFQDSVRDQPKRSAEST